MISIFILWWFTIKEKCYSNNNDCKWIFQFEWSWISISIIKAILLIKVWILLQYCYCVRRIVIKRKKILVSWEFEKRSFRSIPKSLVIFFRKESWELLEEEALCNQENRVHFPFSSVNCPLQRWKQLDRVFYVITSIIEEERKSWRD